MNRGTRAEGLRMADSASSEGKRASKNRWTCPDCGTTWQGDVAGMTCTCQTPEGQMALQLRRCQAEVERLEKENVLLRAQIERLKA